MADPRRGRGDPIAHGNTAPGPARGDRRATTGTGERAGTEPGHGPAVAARELPEYAWSERMGAIAAGALGVAVAAVAAVALLVPQDEPARAADETPSRLPVSTAEIAVCEPAPVSEPASEPAAAPASAQPGHATPKRARIPLKRRRAMVPLDDRTSVVMRTDEGSYELSVKRVDRPRPRWGAKMYEYHPQKGEAVELKVDRQWRVVWEGEP